MITAHFQHIKEAILEEMVAAEESVWLASSYFTDRSIFNLLCALAKKGIVVRLLIADEPVNLVQHNLNYGELVAAGGQFFLANRTAYGSLMPPFWREYAAMASGQRTRD